MEMIVSNEITIIEPIQEVRQWVYEKLRVPNPEYSTRLSTWLRIKEGVSND